MEQVVFHGSAAYDIEKLIKDIQENGFKYKVRDNHWLGQGIYFFSEEEWALMWSNQSRNLSKNKCIITAKIFCEDERFLDLDIVSNHKKIGKYIQEINEILKKEKILLKFRENDRYQKTCFYLDMIKEKYNYKILKQTFPLENKNEITNGIGLYLSQIQFCVTSTKNVEYIGYKTIESPLKNKKILRMEW